ncbi:MAG: chemotaxis-specific protein-glutamate methyltransferase CheB [Candidatus Omnitrophica bacterium]|nr:chemotaxis-specific protein-glutamate methyltransferase CheB [Candidatus Omnitrophota bacterium]
MLPADEKKIRVLIVDDSEFIRTVLREALETAPYIEIVGEADNGRDGIRQAFKLKPDVITMDLKMPIMDGFDAIGKIMEDNPIPIIVVSTLDEEIITKALSMGAMDFVHKARDMQTIAEDLTDKIRIASRIKPITRFKRVHTHRQPRDKAVANEPVQPGSKVIAIGVSTGGPQVTGTLIGLLPETLSTPILVVQHISEGFVQGLVKWMQGVSKLSVSIPSDGEKIKPGNIYFAPDKYHMVVKRKGVIGFEKKISNDEFHVPSIDRLFLSVSEVYGKDAMGIIMTGMGTDGVAGISAMKLVGATTIAQDEASSVIFGMNKAAIEKGVIDKILTPERIAEEIVRF